MTNRDQGDEANEGKKNVVFSSDFSKVPAEVGKDAGVLQPTDVRQLGELQTQIREGREIKAQDSFVDVGERRVWVSGLAKEIESGEISGSWEYSYLKRPDGKLETAGCTISAGGKVEKWKRHFDKRGLVNAETDEVDGEKRKEVVFDRDQQGMATKAVESVYDQNGVKIKETTREFKDSSTECTCTFVEFDEFGKETHRRVEIILSVSGGHSWSDLYRGIKRGPGKRPVDLDEYGIYQSTLDLGKNNPKIFHRV